MLAGLAAFAALTAAEALWAFDLRRIEPPQAAGLKDVIFLDARPEKEWRKSHLPDALSFSWENHTRTDQDGVKWRIPPPEQLAKAFGAMGVGHTDAVLVYGDADTSWGGEGWLVWVLAWLGHQGPVYYLDGGIQGWKAGNHPVSADVGKKRAPATYQANLQPQVNIDSDQIEANKDRINLIDTRGYFKEWLFGHLPGAVHISWEKFYQGPHRRLLSPEALKALLIEQGVDLDKPMVYYCSAGVRSGFAWLAHQLSGLPAAINYEGGVEEWATTRSLVR